MPPKSNPRIPEGINASDDNPLPDFFIMLAGVLGAVVVLIVLLSYLAQWAAPKIHFEWEQRLTRGFSFGSEANSAEGDRALLEASLSELARALSESSPETGVEYQIHWLDEPVPNAFATLGGHIYVTTGLLKSIETENGLAMVLAHEMAHVDARHPIKAASTGIIVQLTLAMLVGDSSSLNSLLGSSGVMASLSFSRDMEREADLLALDKLERYYGHTRGAEEFFAQMQPSKVGAEVWQTFFNTHPGIQERLDIIMLRSDKSSQDTRVPLDNRIVQFINNKRETP